MERYERNALNLVRDLKRLHREIVTLEADGELSYRPRGEVRSNILWNNFQARLVEDQLLSGLQQILHYRGTLGDDAQDDFDVRLEPVRKQIQVRTHTYGCIPDLDHCEYDESASATVYYHKPV